jgi:hypothetical protein
MSHDHPHDHAKDEGPPSEHEILSRALQELLEEKGVLTAEQVRRRMELFEAEFPQRGSRVVAHAWANPAFRKRLLADGKAACAEWGLDLEADRLIAVENTPRVHNVIVCTLCSCYPRALLGMPPTWTRVDWDYIYEPSPEVVLDHVMKRYIESLVYQALLENVASEHAARMVAMKAASDNATKLIGTMQLIYNKARQAAITQEISEIVGGAAAV